MPFSLRPSSHRSLSRLVATVGLALIGLAGCRQEDPHQVTIWNQMRPEERATLDSVLKVFGQQHPEWTFKQLYYENEQLRTNFQIAALGGSGPELLFGPADNVGPFVQLGVIQPLDSLFDAAYLSSFIDDPVPGLTRQDGKLYHIGADVGNHLCLVYNRKLVPTPPRTMAELIEMGQKLTYKDAAGPHYALAWNFIEPFFFVPFVGGYGSGVISPEGKPTLDNEAVVKAAQLVLDLRNKYKLIPKEADYNIADALFKDGRAAMLINGPWSFSAYRDAKIDFGVARIPMLDNGQWPRPMATARGYAMNVNATGEKRQMAAELIRFLTSTDVELAFTRTGGTIPSRQEAFNDPLVAADSTLQQSMRQLEVSQPQPTVKEMRIIWDAMRPPYQALFSNDAPLTPPQAAKKMQSNAERLIDEMNQ